MALWLKHQIDVHGAVNSDGLLPEKFILTNGQSEAVYDVPNQTFSYVKPTKEMRERFKRCTGLFYSYHMCAVYAALVKTALARRSVLVVYHKILAVLDGEDEPSETPYGRV